MLYFLPSFRESQWQKICIYGQMYVVVVQSQLFIWVLKYFFRLRFSFKSQNRMLNKGAFGVHLLSCERTYTYINFSAPTLREVLAQKKCLIYDPSIIVCACSKAQIACSSFQQLGPYDRDDSFFFFLSCYGRLAIFSMTRSISYWIRPA